MLSRSIAIDQECVTACAVCVVFTLGMHLMLKQHTTIALLHTTKLRGCLFRFHVVQAAGRGWHATCFCPGSCCFLLTQHEALVLRTHGADVCVGLAPLSNGARGSNLPG
jgi:hypothetical protein